jgi:hypothetical protein
MISRRWLVILSLFSVLALAIIPGASGRENLYQNVTRLRWAGPPGTEPGSYEDFIREHDLLVVPPLTIREVYRTPAKTLDNHLLIAVEESLYPLIATGLGGYVSDLEDEGYTVTVVLDTAFGGTPLEFRDYLSAVYDSVGLVGALLIGDLPVPWHESTWDDGVYENYPCDYFFMDLDGVWLDNDTNGIYDLHSGDRLPEIWVGRMVASPLSGSEADYVNSLLAKIASYRDGTLAQPQRGLTFIDDDWSYWETCGMDSIYPSGVKVSNDHQTTVADTYAIELGTGYETIQVCAHSWPGGHAFSSRPCDCASYAHAYIESDSSRDCQLQISGQDGFKVWLNGSLILTDANGTQGYEVDLVSATLNQGINSLLVKVAQDKSEYRFKARFTDTAGNLIPGLSYHLEDPGDPDRHAPYITAWLTNGFHPWSNFWTALMYNFLGGEADIDAYEGLVSGGKTWTLWDIGSGFLDFSTIYDDMDVGAVYAFTHVYSDSAQSLTLWLGTYSGAKIWLNGAVVYYDNTYHGFEPDAQEVTLNLVGGWNRLLVKISVWYGAQLSGRIGYSQKLAAEGLAYDPAPTTSDFIHGWLMNGYYKNQNPATRLTQDYLGGEASVQPGEGDSTGSFLWKPGYGSGNWFDLEEYYSEDGGEISSSDIETIDPDGFLYNLFACSAARYTESNYIAGRYAFADTYGLSTIGSTKTGSMLYFEGFYEELGNGQCVGKALQEWFRKQGQDGFYNWEVCWYYGLVLIGDPTLRVNICSAPLAIDDLTVDLAGSDIYLKWTEPYGECGIAHYVVYRSTSAGSLGDSLVSTADTTHADMGAAGAVGSNYFYTVKAVDNVGQKSQESSQVGEFDRNLSNMK